MKNNSIYSKFHSKFFDRIIFEKRLEIVKIINKIILSSEIKDVLDIGTTSDNINASSNLIIKNLKNIKNLYSISDQKVNLPHFDKTLQKSITESFSQNEINEFKSDLVISNATIEHVGNKENQKKMIDNMIKFSRKFFIIITPNKFHPLDFHTKIPFIHWLPKIIHKKILKMLNLSFYAKEENLNLLSKSDILNLINKDEMEYEFKFIRLMFFKSNLIFIAKKTKF